MDVFRTVNTKALLLEFIKKIKVKEISFIITKKDIEARASWVITHIKGIRGTRPSLLANNFHPAVSLLNYGSSNILAIKEP